MMNKKDKTEVILYLEEMFKTMGLSVTFVGAEIAELKSKKKSKKKKNARTKNI